VSRGYRARIFLHGTLMNREIDRNHKKPPTNRPAACFIFVETLVCHVPLTDEPDLIVSAQQGDRQAFADLVRHYWDRLFRWLFHLTHDAHAAEDLTQESFLKAFAALDSFQAGTNFRAWLFRIAHNNWANQRRKERVRLTFPDDVESHEESPPELAMDREAFQQLARAVGRLPGDYRAAFLLRVEEDLSFRDIGETLGITEETARWRVCKARQKLMEVLGPFLG
jgi:RNA polymerase sigma-70 factor (ECF subfamily)